MNNVCETHITPNFLHSILTNDTLYEMFKDDFDNNKSYFQNITKEVYIEQISEYISNNLKNYSDDKEYLNCFKKFYDDFILPKIDEKPENIFDLTLFKSIREVYEENKINNNEALLSFYNYIFSSSKYFDKSDFIIRQIKSEMQNNKLSVSDYQILTNYVKNTIDDIIPLDIACLLIRNHAFKYNHIFDANITKKIVLSIANDFFRKYDIRINIQYNELILSKNVKTHDIDTNTIYIDSILIDTFISGNYVELLSNLFFKLILFKDDYLLKANLINLDTLKTIWRCVNNKVEIDKVFIDEKYHPYDYLSEMESNAFIMALRFLNSIGINLFNNYLSSQTRSLDFKNITIKSSPKEISEEMKFINRFSKTEKEKIGFFRNKYKVISFFYGSDGKRKKAIDLINMCDDENIELVFSYLTQIIPEPIYLIDDIVDITGQDYEKDSIKDLVFRLSKYIYPDMFYYSLESFILMNEEKTSFDKDIYLSELYVRISSIKETDETKNFLKNAINAIELMKQN